MNPISSSFQGLKANIINSNSELTNVAKIGKIVSLNKNIAKVSIVEKRSFDTKIVSSPVVTCSILTNNITNGVREYYSVGEKVLVLFLDYYSLDNITKEFAVIGKKDKDLNNKNSINNGVIIGKVSNNEALETALYDIDSKFAIDKTDKKLTIKTKDESLKPILELLITNQNLLNTHLITLLNILKAQITTIKALVTSTGGFLNKDTMDAHFIALEQLVVQLTNFSNDILENNNKINLLLKE